MTGTRHREAALAQDEPAAGARRKGSDTRARIRQVALDLFTEQGYEATSMREIAERLDISKAALYYHFESKESILEDLFTDYLDAIDEVIETTAERPPSRERSAALVDRWLEVTAASGLRVIRFAAMNQAVMRATATVSREQAMRRFDRATDLMVGADAPVRDRLRARMAIMCLHSAAIAAKGIEVDDAEIVAAAREAAAALIERIDLPD